MDVGKGGKRFGKHCIVKVVSAGIQKENVFSGQHTKLLNISQVYCSVVPDWKHNMTKEVQNVVLSTIPNHHCYLNI